MDFSKKLFALVLVSPFLCGIRLVNNTDFPLVVWKEDERYRQVMPIGQLPLSPVCTIQPSYMSDELRADFSVTAQDRSCGASFFRKEDMSCISECTRVGRPFSIKEIESCFIMAREPFSESELYPQYEYYGDTPGCADILMIHSSKQDIGSTAYDSRIDWRAAFRFLWRYRLHIVELKKAELNPACSDAKPIPLPVLPGALSAAPAMVYIPAQPVVVQSAAATTSMPQSQQKAGTLPISRAGKITRLFDCISQ